ncbi:unnamed protein product [Didymodactylos carnosus]|nr:unnamed protein product [Didymodactylos carnosus]CAF4227385.1 unnamed protein product [Didymodactylos carnosus]
MMEEGCPAGQLPLPMWNGIDFITGIDLSERVDHAAHTGGALMGIFVAGYMCEFPNFVKAKIDDKRIKSISFISIMAYLVFTLLLFFVIKSPY